MQPEQHEDLPETAHDGPGQPGSEAEDRVDAGGQALRGEGGDRADRHEDERDHDEDAQQRGAEVAERRGDDPVEEALQVSLQPDRHDDRDHRAGVAHHHHRQAREGHRGPGGGQLHDRGVDQGAGDGHGGELVRLEPPGGGDRQEQRQEVEDRISGRGQDDGGLGLGVQPAELGGRAQERLEQTGSGQRPDDRLEDRGDQVDEPVEDVPAGGIVCGGRFVVGHVVADHDLVLTPCLHHRDHPGQLLDGGFVRLGVVAQLQAQTGGAVGG